MPSAWRVLQQAEDDHDDHASPSSSLLSTQNTTTDVRVIAIFTILLAGLSGGFVVLFVPVFRKPNHPDHPNHPDGAADLEGLSSHQKVSTSDPGPTPAVSAYMFELGCIVHSFLIGFTFGVTVNDWAQAVTLTIALVFHLALEAIGLGTVIVKARFSTLKSIVMVTTYALTVPVGIAIGMGVASSYIYESVVALTVQGILNSISGGLLLYIALVQMIAQDFAHMTGGLLVQIGMYVMIALGATCMILIAVFGENGAHVH
ncbi:hypothetical protein FOA52_006219 [Chlamydomonas sp. UWO 241]|nr:hypothetical protein FOA52_006219 [Chlamydomonas sp. UWO 241]